MRSLKLGAVDGSVNVDAILDENSNTRAYGLSAGICAYSAQVAVLVDNAMVYAYVRDHAEIRQAGDSVNIKATSNRTINLQAISAVFSFGMVGASYGASVTVGVIEGETKAFAHQVLIGQDFW